MPRTVAAQMDTQHTTTTGKDIPCLYMYVDFSPPNRRSLSAPVDPVYSAALAHMMGNHA